MGDDHEEQAEKPPTQVIEPQGIESTATVMSTPTEDDQ